MGGDSKKSAGHWVQAEAKGPVSPQVDTESHPILQIQVGLAGFVCSKKIGTCFFWVKPSFQCDMNNHVHRLFVFYSCVFLLYFTYFDI